ncbi:adenylate/guanylate cyclase domain-containing protein [Kumtagia ephedrae]|jgi:adenylate cyclase|uniref:Adenylate/guanylate cyclase domain-containing protein n=1 Tax=Kumtagia ephedrae TaxID=2116701 RepID=A0A2P7S3C7_9HYPH|nr:adenylate/guanylate cyclase domain-containing protein [Mesorhizobium ephedrae]PSJ56972.1 adenylate/guanylate cyclase domain-containing protein [Mesorhizobium ephedrae]
MTNGAQADVSTILMDKVADWLTASSLAGDDLETMVRGFCERLAAAGMPIARVHLSFSMLHPLYDALGFTWERGSGMRVEGFRQKPGQKSEQFLRSPYYYLLNNKLDHLRRRIDYSGPSEFPIFDDLKTLGVTDYLAFRHMFTAGREQGMLGSWSTDAPSGFTEGMIAALLRIQNHLAVAAKMAVLNRLADNMLTTYLGNDAGKRVLNGNIRRGQGDTIRAALVMADMRGSTMMAEQEGREAYIDTLNQFFDAIAAPFNRRGGQILSFLGDGFIAVYPCDRHHEPSEIACKAALSAAHKATARMAALNEDRRRRGLAEIGYGIGLHVGNVMFGNVGLNDRLTFSAFGSAVNEVQRLQALTKKYPHSLIASEEFAGYSGGGWINIGKEKLRGVKERLTILHPDMTDIVDSEDDAFEISYDGVSDAEQLMLLYRDSAGAGSTGNGKAVQ